MPVGYGVEVAVLRRVGDGVGGAFSVRVIEELSMVDVSEVVISRIAADLVGIFVGVMAKVGTGRASVGRGSV